MGMRMKRREDKIEEVERLMKNGRGKECIIK